jgi:hypothetical protein
MKTNVLFIFLLLPFLFFSCSEGKEIKQKRPNVLFVYVDDLGYGDPGCYNPGWKLSTPAFD